MGSRNTSGWKKSIQVCRYLFQNRFWTVNTLMVYILLVVFISYYIRPIAAYCLAQKVAVTPWIFPFMSSDYMLQIFMVAGAIFLLADVPFYEENGMYLLYRTGTVSWQVGTVLYMLVTAVLYVLSIGGIALLSLADVVQFSSEWGKIFGTLMQTGVSQETGIPMDFSYTMFRFTPAKATVYSFLLEVACILWLGCVIYTGNLLLKHKMGVLIAVVYLFLDAVIANTLPRSIYQYSPLSLSQLANYNGDLEREGVTFLYAVLFFSFSFILFIIVIFYTGHMKCKKSGISHVSE